MPKKPAPQETIDAFFAALYPMSTALAMASATEESCLADATAAILEARAEAASVRAHAKRAEDEVVSLSGQLGKVQYALDLMRFAIQDRLDACFCKSGGYENGEIVSQPCDVCDALRAVLAKGETP